MLLWFQSDIDNFWKDFKLFMMYSMIIQQRAPSVERTIDFIAKFVTMTTSSVPEPEDQNDSTMDDVTNNKLLQKMLDFLLEVCLVFFSQKYFLYGSNIVNLDLSSFRNNCHNQFILIIDVLLWCRVKYVWYFLSKPCRKWTIVAPCILIKLLPDKTL